MMLFRHFPAVLALLFISAELSNAASANCTVETAVLDKNPNITAAYDEFFEGISEQVRSCYVNAVNPCDVNYDTTTIEETCTAAGGQFQTPELTLSCTNSNTNVKTTIVNTYVLCLGQSCDGSAFVEATNNALTNITDTANAVLEQYGVQCSAEVSGANQLFASMGLMMVMGIVSVLL
jgi:hypothetical protein